MGAIMKVEITFVDDNKKSLNARSFCVKESEYEVEVVEDGISVEYHFPKFNVKCIKRYPFLFDDELNGPACIVELEEPAYIFPEKYKQEDKIMRSLGQKTSRDVIEKYGADVTSENRDIKEKQEVFRSTRSRLEFLNKKKNFSKR